MIDLARLDRIARRTRPVRSARNRGTRSLGTLPGRRLAPQQGLGLSLAGHREYGFGDDVRHIDWRVTARLARPFVKVFQRERSGTVLVLVDASASIRDLVGSKRALEAAALIILIAAYGQERVGVAQFTNRVEWVRPPRRGRAHALAAIRAMETFSPASRQTSIATALAHADRLLRAAATIVIISDFIDREYEPAMAALRRHHVVVAVCLSRPPSAPLGSGGNLLRMRDPESARTRWLDIGDRRVIAALETSQRALVDRRRLLFNTLNVPYFEIPDAGGRLESDRAAEQISLRVGEHL